jgi:integrase
MAAGIRQRHRNDCNRRGKCECTWQAEVYDAEAKEKIRKPFPTYAAARSWRHDALVALREGRLRAVGGATLDEVAEAWLAGAETGTIRARGGYMFKPATVRAYERGLRLRVLPELGLRRLGDIRRTDVQALVDDLVADESAAATIHTTIAALQTVCRHELRRGRLTVNPADNLELPAVRNGRECVIGVPAAAALLSALPEADRALWATAMYGGLRRGELRALRASDVDLAAGVIRVERSVDDKAGVGETKGRNKRRVPIPSALRQRLREHLMRTGRRDDELLFGPTGVSPFSPTRVTERADKAWEKAKLERITLHECRHCYASYMIAAGVNVKALSTFMGHAKVAITLDLYGHLLPGSEDEAAGLLDAYLDAERVGG